MPTLTLPHTLTAGQPENVNELMANLVAIRDAINGTLDATNLATSAKPATLLGQWRTISEVDAVGNSGASTGGAAGVHWFRETMKLTTSNDSNPFPIVNFDPADYSVTGLTTRLRVRAGTVSRSSVVPGLIATFGLYPITAAGSANAFGATAGTVVAGSTVAFTMDTAGAELQGVSSEFATPAAGIYALGVSFSSGIDADGAAVFQAALQVHHI